METANLVQGGTLPIHGPSRGCYSTLLRQVDLQSLRTIAAPFATLRTIILCAFCVPAFPHSQDLVWTSASTISSFGEGRTVIYGWHHELVENSSRDVGLE